MVCDQPGAGADPAGAELGTQIVIVSGENLGKRQFEEYILAQLQEHQLILLLLPAASVRPTLLDQYRAGLLIFIHRCRPFPECGGTGAGRVQVTGVTVRFVIAAWIPTNYCPKQ